MGFKDMSEEFNLEAYLAKIDGKIDLVQQAVDTTKEDMRQTRSRVHDLSNEVQRLIALNISGTLETLTKDLQETEGRVLVLEHDLHERRGAVNVAKIIYGLGGTTVGAGTVAALAQLFGG